MIQLPTPPKLLTGTTIVGISLPHLNTILLASDTRATEGVIVSTNKCQKIFPLSRNCWVCGAGTYGDIQFLVRKVRYTFEYRRLMELSIGNEDTNLNNYPNNNDKNNKYYVDMQGLPQVHIQSVCKLFKKELYEEKGSLGVDLLLGGYDYQQNRSLLCKIDYKGFLEIVPYSALGSGGIVATGLLESRYKNNMTLNEGIDLIKDCVLSGIENDLGSGSMVDICIVNKHWSEYKRGVVEEEKLKVYGEKVKNINKVYRIEEGGRLNGVNGFGTMCLELKKCGTVVGNEEEKEKFREDWLNYFFFCNELGKKKNHEKNTCNKCISN